MRRIASTPKVPVIDLFAGPGGLGEGFSVYEFRGKRAYNVRLSVEKELIACNTLILRRFFHLAGKPNAEYYEYLRGRLPREELFDRHPVAARAAISSIWCAELGKEPQHNVNARVSRALGRARAWVLLGGPPCQAYSIVGRSRMQRTHRDFESDERHFLYREYLRIVAKHAPPVFVLENVKGLLSAKHGGEGIFHRILSDLAAPGKALRIPGKKGLSYRLHAISPNAKQQEFMSNADKLQASDFLLFSEQHGIPQARHRVFIIGVRSDIKDIPERLEFESTVDASSVLDDLPAIRSCLSQESDSYEAWVHAIRQIESYEWMACKGDDPLAPVVREVRSAIQSMTTQVLNNGALFAAHTRGPPSLKNWYRKDMVGITQHEARSHMREDLHRYLFSACYARIHGVSPHLRDFPKELLPDHANRDKAVKGEMFGDRFRLQIPDRPATTITSHISKDGHYFIHYAPEQCRSFTVREAARIQTFPDNYWFEGNRTEQYHQVGNAVPPLLARKIAALVYSVLDGWKS